MKNYNGIPLTVNRYPESWFSFPQSFCVPKGCLYRKDTDKDFRYAASEVTIELYCAGDWLEIVDEDENQCIRYEIY